jgi:Uroporphyrinogen decarboxylase (URO-D)
MTPRERVQMALAHEAPDRCPWQASFTPEFARRLRQELGLSAGPEHNPHGGGNTYELERHLGQDLLLVSVGWANSYYQSQQDYVDEWGVGWKAAKYETPFGQGVYTEIAEHPLADGQALDSYCPPDPCRPDLYDDAAALVRDYKSTHWLVGVTVTTIFETAWALRGLDQLMMNFVREPELAEAILEIPYRYHLAAASRLVELGIDMIWVGDDIGAQQGMLLSPAMWRRFLKPRLAEFFATLRRINPAIKIAYHSDGVIEPVIPDLIEIGLDVLNPIQPTCVDPAEVKRRYGDQLAFWGSIDVQSTLPFGSPAEVASEVRSRLETLGQGGGLILAPTHHVQLDTPMENFRALVRAITGRWSG